MGGHQSRHQVTARQQKRHQATEGQQKRHQATAGQQSGPQTTAGQQSGPQTTAGQQSGPQTTAGQQSGPQTTAGQQSLPQTTAGQQSGPQTTAGQQSGPQTTAGQQSGPQTTAGQQSGPQTTAGQQSGPQTTAGQQSGPQTTAGQQSLPQTTAGQQSGPQTTAGQQSGPQTTAGQQSGPQTTAGQQSGPQTTAGQQSGPQTTAGQQSGPQTTAGQQSLPQTTAGQQSGPQTSNSNWRQIVTSLYPDALTRTYCVPPINFNKVSYARDTVPGTGHSALVLHPPSGAAPGHNVPPVSQRPVPPSGTAPVHNVPPVSQRPVPSSQYSLWSQESQPQAIPRRVQESDFRDDFAQNHVMLNLQELRNTFSTGRTEGMFILSQLSFGNYLNQPAYTAAAAQLPRPLQLDTKKIKYSHGEADFVLIHRQHGILIGELKSVGKSQAGAQNPQPPADADVAKRVTKAVKQLDRSETVVRHLVSDVAPGLTMKKTLFLPYVSTEQLQRVLDNDPQLKQAVCQSLGAGSAVEASQLCCCSDQLSQPASYSHVTPAVLSQLSTWWQLRVARTVDTLLTDDNYLDIVARFVGPATTVSVPCHNGVRVEVRTAGQAVAELGRRLALLVLTLQQLALMNGNPPLVCLTGPPGTGKTVLLVLQGLRWLLQGHDVQVVSTDYITRAASRMIAGQLGMALSADQTPPPTPGSIALHEYDFNREADVQQAVTDLLARVKDGQLHVLLDEAFFDSSLVLGQRLTTLVTRLAESVPGLHLWAAGVAHTDIPPSLRPEPLTVPLRCAPSVLREVQPAIDRATGQVHNYSDSGVPAPGDGLRVIRLSHHGNAHTGRWPVECRQCGQEVAAELRRLGVGSGGSSLPNSPTPLSYRDVLIITRSSELQDDIKDDADRVTSRASGVVRGLRDEGLPVCVLGEQDRRHNRARWERDVHDVAVAATDRVTVTRYHYVQGLERRVVVMLSGRDKETDEGRSDEEIDLMDRLVAASRCSTQLIMVDVPPVTTATSTAT